MPWSPTTSRGGTGGGTSALTQVFTSTLSGSAASIDSGAVIPGTGTDLVVSFSTRGDSANASESIILRFNNDSGANYWSSTMGGNTAVVAGESVASEASTFARAGRHPASLATANLFGTGELFVASYATTTRIKTFRALDAHAGALSATNHWWSVSEGNWNSTAAITRVAILPGAGNFVAGSRMTIWIRT